jgi:hypothetical protein
MKTIIYTFLNKKPIFFEKDRFYIIKNKKQYIDLIDLLMYIDAVSTPHSPHEDKIKYPIILELQYGFTPKLILSSDKELKKINIKINKLLKNKN